MNIEIRGLSGGLVQNTGDSAKTGEGGTRPAKTAVGEGQTDRVRLTDSANRLQDLEGRVAGLPVVDTQRVEAVRLELATGDFQIDPVSTADKVLEMERELP